MPDAPHPPPTSLDQPAGARSPIEVRVAIACQGGGAHTAFTAGVLDRLVEAMQAPEDDGDRPVRLRIVGLSGTSGGAICAALAWKALLLGTPEARQDLRRFWVERYPEGNASDDLTDPAGLMLALGAVAQAALREGPGAWLRWLDATRLAAGRMAMAWPPLAELFPVHWPPVLQPYAMPRLFEALDRLTLAPFNPLLRDDPAADRALAAMMPMLAPWLAPALDGMRALGAWNPLVPGSAIRREFDAQEAMRALLRRYFPEDALEAMKRAVRQRKALAARGAGPGRLELLIGAVDVQRAHADGSRSLAAHVEEDFVEPEDYRRARQTNFKVFRASERLPELVEMMLASAALPELMRAVILDGSPHWDGLLSHNPPISDLADLYGRAAPGSADNPEEILVVRINPMEARSEPRTFAAIADRRNALAGNLSLLHEIKAVRRMNDVARESARRRAAGGEAGADGDYRVISFGFIDIAEAVASGLGHASKLDRRASFLAALFDHGREQAARFLDRWTAAERAWAERA